MSKTRKNQNDRKSRDARPEAIRGDGGHDGAVRLKDAGPIDDPDPDTGTDDGPNAAKDPSIKAEQDQAGRGSILSGLVGTLAGAALRGAVFRELSHRNSLGQDTGKAGQHSPSRKLASFGIRALVTRSVPGAVVVASGLMVQSLYRRRRARQQLGAAPSPSPITGPAED